MPDGVAGSENWAWICPRSTTLNMHARIVACIVKPGGESGEGVEREEGEGGWREGVEREGGEKGRGRVER